MPRSIRSPLATAVLLAALTGCVIPPGPATKPSSGDAGQRRASMTAARDKTKNPFAEVYWVVDPESNAHRTANNWRTTRPADAAAMDKLAGQPSAAWMGNWNPNVELDVKTYVWSRTRAGGLP